jgi:hypothetical protein
VFAYFYKEFTVKKILLLLVGAIFALTMTVPAFADGNPWPPPGKTASSLSTVLADGNPWPPPGK